MFCNPEQHAYEEYRILVTLYSIDLEQGHATATGSVCLQQSIFDASYLLTVAAATYAALQVLQTRAKALAISVQP